MDGLKISQKPIGKPMGKPILVTSWSRMSIGLLENTVRDTKRLIGATHAVIGERVRVDDRRVTYGGGMPPVSYEEGSKRAIYAVQFYKINKSSK